jgi:ATP-dependent RNA helicase DDX19/DBP5
MLMEIQKYFNTHIEGIETRDWDAVEKMIKKTIKNPRSRPDFATATATQAS